MNTLKYVAVGGLILAAIGAAVWATRDAPRGATTAIAARAANINGQIVFPHGDPRLSFLKVRPADATAVPVADAVSGRIAYDETRTSRIASPVLGRVTGQRVEIGDRVDSGDLLAELDSPDLAGAQADARKADADEERKRLALARARMLFNADVLARKDLESADADYSQADAEAKRARQRISNLHAGTRIDGKFGLRAPIAGMVTDKQINVGQEVRPDQANPLLVISDLRHVWAVADVPERLAAQLQRGQAVSVDTDAWAGAPVLGHIDRIGVAVDPITRRVQVRCTLDNLDGRLKPDMFARIAFMAGASAHGALALPNTALFTEDNGTFVFVERHAGVFEKRRVHVVMGGAERSFIDNGLRAHERVVTEGALLLNAEAADHAG